MTAPIIQARYDELDQIALRFGRSAEVQRTLIRTIQQQADVLTGGCWQGRGVTAFARELDNTVMPAMARLAEALLEAQRGTLQIAAIMHAAEEEAAQPFLSEERDALSQADSSGATTAVKSPVPFPAIAWWNNTLAFGDQILEIAEDIAAILPPIAAAIVAASITTGSKYGGQVIFSVPDWVGSIGISKPWVKELAGVSPHLTHIKETNVATHIGKAAGKVTLIAAIIGVARTTVDVAQTWTANWDEYIGYGDTSRHVSAMYVDAHIAALPIVLETVGSIGGAILAVSIMTPFTAPVVIVSAAVAGYFGSKVGGILGHWVVEQIEENASREMMIDSIDRYVVQPVADGISQSLQTIRDNVAPGWDLAELNFSL